MAAHLKHGRPHQLLESHHGGDRIARKAEGQRLSDFPEGDRLAGANRQLPKIHVATELLKDRFCKIVVAHGDAAGEHENVRVQALADLGF